MSAPAVDPLFAPAIGTFRLVEDLVEGAIVVDRHSVITWISESYRRFLGLAPELEVVGRPIEELIPHSLMREVVERGTAYPLDLMQFGERLLLVSRLPMRDEQGTIVGGVAFAFKHSLAHLKPLAQRISQLENRLAQAERELVNQRMSKYTLEHIIGFSPAILEVKRLVRRAAQINTTVLLLGETGTGKELVAHAVHSASARSDQPFVSVNLAAVPESLMEAEFFGVAPGAYTGAGKQYRRGKFELADGGTLFLDEVGDMPLHLQAKLLRVLQDREFEPLGANRVVHADVRVIAATSHDLKAMVDDGRFRADLYYRLNVLPILVPPLRERLEDVGLLASHLLERTAQAHETPVRGLSSEARQLLQMHQWPGNVRELANVLEQACVRTDSLQLDVADFAGILPAEVLSHADADRGGLEQTLAAAERAAILSALTAAGGNKALAARRLGISRPSLYAKLKRYR